MRVRGLNKGFVQTVILIVVALLLLSYFQIDLKNLDMRSLLNSTTMQNNMDFIWQQTQNLWYNYIKAPVVYALNFILHLIQ